MSLIGEKTILFQKENKNLVTLCQEETAFPWWASAFSDGIFSFEEGQLWCFYMPFQILRRRSSDISSFLETSVLPGKPTASQPSTSWPVVSLQFGDVYFPSFLPNSVHFLQWNLKVLGSMQTELRLFCLWSVAPFMMEGHCLATVTIFL